MGGSGNNLPAGNSHSGIRIQSPGVEARYWKLQASGAQPSQIKVPGWGSPGVPSPAKRNLTFGDGKTPPRETRHSPATSPPRVPGWRGRSPLPFEPFPLKLWHGRQPVSPAKVDRHPRVSRIGPFRRKNFRGSVAPSGFPREPLFTPASPVQEAKTFPA